jgi:gliding motility-associated-like protein
MRYNETNNRQFSGFPPVPEHLPAPPEAVWDGIRRGMKRKDFWRVKGKVLATALLCASATALFFAVNSGREIPQPAGTAALAPSTTPDTLHNVPTLTEISEATTVSQQSAATHPATATALSETAQTPAAEEPAVVQVTETVSETTLPIKETPIPSAVPADRHPERIVKTPATEREQKPSDNQTPSPEPSESVLASFPSAFTPNGDGLNDTYRPVLSGEVTQYLLRIYNRKNQLVFQTTHPEESWDGNYRGTVQPHGAYLFILQYTTEKGEKKTEKGEFLLLRD